jgi:hypothetical protein
MTRRFLSVDPLDPVVGSGWAGNPYWFAGHDPLHAIDPLELQFRRVCIWSTLVHVDALIGKPLRLRDHAPMHDGHYWRTFSRHPKAILTSNVRSHFIFICLVGAFLANTINSWTYYLDQAMSSC